MNPPKISELRMRAIVAIAWMNKAVAASQPPLTVDLAIAITIVITRVTAKRVTTSSIVAVHHNNGRARKMSMTPKRVVNKPCPKQSREGKPTQHMWAKSSLNKANKNHVLNRCEHKAYANDPCQPNNDKSYDDGSHHTPDVSGNDYSHHSEFWTEKNYGVF